MGRVNVCIQEGRLRSCIHKKKRRTRILPLLKKKKSQDELKSYDKFQVRASQGRFSFGGYNSSPSQARSRCCIYIYFTYVRAPSRGIRSVRGDTPPPPASASVPAVGSPLLTTEDAEVAALIIATPSEPTVFVGDSAIIPAWVVDPLAESRDPRRPWPPL